MIGDVIQINKKNILMTICDKIIDNEMDMVNNQNYDFIYDILDMCLNYMDREDELKRKMKNKKWNQ